MLLELIFWPALGLLIFSVGGAGDGALMFWAPLLATAIGPVRLCCLWPALMRPLWSALILGALYAMASYFVAWLIVMSSPNYQSYIDRAGGWSGLTEAVMLVATPATAVPGLIIGGLAYVFFKDAGQERLADTHTSGTAVS